MKLISWNVNGIRAIAKKGFLEFVGKMRPDILCLQETKAHKDQVEPELINPFGLVSHWSSAFRPGYSGTATYSNSAPKSVSYGIGIKKFDTEGRFVITDFEDFLLYNIYFPNGGSGEERHLFKQEFLKKLLAHLQQVLKSGREIMVVGDYNVAHKDIDVYDPVKLADQSGFLPEERIWFGQFLEAGFIDCFRELHPDEKHRYSWWDYRSKAKLGNRGWRIDYACASKNLFKRVKTCDLLDDVAGSDHCPVYLEFQ